MNLLANAISWTPPGRDIEVVVRAREASLAIVVVDEGYGIAQADVPALFQRVRASSSRQGAGSGLGLYLVRRIAEAHGGNVAYAPRAGGGSSFELTLPRAPTVVAGAPSIAS